MHDDPKRPTGRQPFAWLMAAIKADLRIGEVDELKVLIALGDERLKGKSARDLKDLRGLDAETLNWVLQKVPERSLSDKILLAIGFVVIVGGGTVAEIFFG